MAEVENGFLTGGHVPALTGCDFHIGNHTYSYTYMAPAGWHVSAVAGRDQRADGRGPRHARAPSPPHLRPPPLPPQGLQSEEHLEHKRHYPLCPSRAGNDSQVRIACEGNRARACRWQEVSLVSPPLFMSSQRPSPPAPVPRSISCS